MTSHRAEHLESWMVTREISTLGDPIIEGLLAISLAGAGRSAEAAQLCDGGQALRAWCVCAYAMSGRPDAAVQIARSILDGGRGDVEVQACLGHVHAAVDILEASEAAQDAPLVLLCEGRQSTSI